jgi:hypothetical protein
MKQPNIRKYVIGKKKLGKGMRQWRSELSFGNHPDSKKSDIYSKTICKFLSWTAILDQYELSYI